MENASQKIDFNDQISANKRKSFFLMLVIFSVFVLFGYIISNVFFAPGFFFAIMMLFTSFSIIYLIVTYYNSGKIAVVSIGAKKANPKKHREYYSLVEGLTIASGMPMPELYVMPSSQINAFASGRDPNHAIICVTLGALEKLDKRELEGVLAHELSHISNYDMRYMTLVAVMVGSIAIMSELFLKSLWFSNKESKNNWVFLLIGIIMAILAPIFVHLVYLSISRKREYSADASAIKFTRYPLGLISALKKIKHDYSLEQLEDEKKVSKVIAPLFFSTPFRKGLEELGSTHPPIEKRIESLEKM